MDENCLRQFKVAGMKFRVGLAQPVQCSLKASAPPLTVAAHKGSGIVMGGQQQFAIEGRRRHFAGDVTTDDKVVGGQVQRLGGTAPAEYEQQQ
ncbi:protein of unknown function [Pseudomonas sp. JV241A]|nr:protein of unknown function [Pseudomonas sp. JV241A]